MEASHVTAIVVPDQGKIPGTDAQKSAVSGKKRPRTDTQPVVISRDKLVLNISGGKLVFCK